MQRQYLEIVTPDADAVCTAYGAAHGTLAIYILGGVHHARWQV